MRRTTKRISRAIILMAALGLSGSRAYSCWCGIHSVSKAFEQARSVFVGEVIEVVPPRVASADTRPDDGLFTIKFKVERYWKGVSTDEFSVLSAQGKECFAYPAVSKGEKYLVYADPLYSEEGFSKDLVIITTCNRTARLPPIPSIRYRFGASGFTRTDGSLDVEILDCLAKRPYSLNHSPFEFISPGLASPSGLYPAIPVRDGDRGLLPCGDDLWEPGPPPGWVRW